MNLSRLFAPIALVSVIALSGISGSALADTTLRIGVTPCRTPTSSTSSSRRLRRKA